ncbi:MAG: 3-methyladenine DNA glycosylase [Puniceicoccaceae bacterium MED-G32]|jgi:DNA-3-methyladenine glycosylase|nr:MAG: 3-methyladenine DNA glycosylase [Puniceicoccaceae bacterium MED-G32]CAI8323550.1 MAG: Putative 3-methyladenine DNA glycosylase [Puniceicoccaceae bacterium MED-G32]|tara:strand:+ start:18131 stop:18682 length:552 start_codon:yes stop_codon:yes gene_type:complete
MNDSDPNILKDHFFERDSFLVAEEILGCALVRELPDGNLIRSIISEVEVYDGFLDKASHAHRGITKRNQVMFGPPGRAYVYLCYGMHWLLNITTRESGYPAALLIRSVSDCKGPGRTTRFFHINGEQNNQSLNKENGLWLEANKNKLLKNIKKEPRVGIDYAGKPWVNKLYRYGLKSLEDCTN